MAGISCTLRACISLYMPSPTLLLHHQSPRALSPSSILSPRDHRRSRPSSHRCHSMCELLCNLCLRCGRTDRPLLAAEDVLQSIRFASRQRFMPACVVPDHIWERWSGRHVPQNFNLRQSYQPCVMTICLGSERSVGVAFRVSRVV